MFLLLLWNLRLLRRLRRLAMTWMGRQVRFIAPYKPCSTIPWPARHRFFNQNTPARRNAAFA
jgi:hypothetical protein